jgi:hypothetical protein
MSETVTIANPELVINATAEAAIAIPGLFEAN